MAKMNIKKGDKVLVITGKDTGKTAEVLSCFPEENKVTVKGLNIIVKHNKPRSAQDKGGIVKKEGKILASNVMVVCPSCGKATRVAHKVNEDGSKVRTCKHCGESLDNVKKSSAKKTTKAEEKPAKETAKKETAKKETKPAEKKTAKSTETKVEEKKVEEKATEKKVEKAETAKKAETKKAPAKAAEKKTTEKSAK